LFILIIKVFKKIYKVIAVLLAVTLFFIFYNYYLVDRSLVNLNFALNALAQAQTVEDFNKIKPFLKAPLLNELAKKNASPEVILSLGVANSILSNPNALKQKGEIQLYIKNVIKLKEASKNKVLFVIDRLNSEIFKSKEVLVEANIASEVNKIQTKLQSAADINLRQALTYDLGNIYFRNNDFIKAQEAFLLVINYAPDAKIAWQSKFNLGLSYEYSGDYDKALSIFDEVSKHKQDLKLAVSAKFEFANVLYALKRYRQARDKYAQLAIESPQFESSALALYRAGTISMYELKDFKTALKLFYKLAMIRAGSTSYFDLKDIDSALDFFTALENNLSRSDPTAVYVKKDLRKLIARDFKIKGYKLILKEQYNEAILDFNRAVHIDPNDSLSIVGEGVALYYLGFNDQAYQKAKEAAIVGLDNELTLTNAIFICIKAGYLDKAIEIGEQFIAKRMVSVARPEFYYNLGYAYAFKGKLNNALTYLNKAVRMDESFVFVYNNLGCILWSKKDYSSAMKMFQKAVSIKPSYADAYYNLGIALFQLNRLDEAYREFQLSLDADPKNKSAKKFLADIESTLKYNPLEISVTEQKSQ